MIKAKVIKPFYYAKDKELYVDENRYNELKTLGLIEKIEDVEIETTKLFANKKIINVETKVIKPKK